MSRRSKIPPPFAGAAGAGAGAGAARATGAAGAGAGAAATGAGTAAVGGPARPSPITGPTLTASPLSPVQISLSIFDTSSRGNMRGFTISKNTTAVTADI